MPNNTLLLEVINYFVQNEKLFTSVDIANTIKLSGTWISNAHVAKFLRDQMSEIAPHYYNASIEVTIPASKELTLATLYYPPTNCPADYTADQRAQRALAPQEVTELEEEAESLRDPTAYQTGLIATRLESVPRPHIAINININLPNDTEIK